MHCYICVTYMIIITSANPWIAREPTAKPEQRSLFHDVIESLRLRARTDETNNDNNDLTQNYEQYGYEQEPLQLPSDAGFIPRRNDRIEVTRLNYRFPKNIDVNNGDRIAIKEVEGKSIDKNDTKAKEVVVFIDTHNRPVKPIQRPKRPQFNKQKPIKNKENVEQETQEPPATEDNLQLTNTMAGQSQIGNRETQTVIKPTVIVNLRGSVSHTDSDIRLERKGNNQTYITEDVPRNIFNINQEVNLDRATPKKDNKIKQEVKGVKDEDMMMCETGTYKSESKVDGERKFDNVFQILFAL